MADNGIRTTNLPLGSVIEVLGHSDAGNGQPGAIVREPIEDFVQHLRELGGLDPSGVADLSSRLNAILIDAPDDANTFAEVAGKLSAEALARAGADAALAVSAAGLWSRIVPLASASNGAAIAISGARPVGLNIPANVSGLNSFVTPYIAMTGDDIARLVGRTIKLSVALTATSGFLSAHPFGTEAVQVGKGGSTYGAVLRTLQDGLTIYRDVTYTIQGFETDLGIPLRIASGAATGTAHSCTINSVTWSVVDAGSSAETPSGVGLDIAIRKAMLAQDGIGSILEDVAPQYAMLGGAQPLTGYGGNVLGWAIPAGQTGGNSFVQPVLAFEPVDAKALVGRTILVALGLDTSDWYARPLTSTLKLYTATTQAAAPDSRVVLDYQLSKNRRLIVLSGTFVGGSIWLAPTLQQSSGSVITGTTDTLVITDLVVAIASTPSDTTTVGQENRALAGRAATRRAARLAPEPRGDAYAYTLRVEADGSGDFSTPDAALAAITDAGPMRRWLIRMGDGPFVTTGVVLKDYVDVAGNGRTWLRGYLPPSTDPAVIATAATVTGNAKSRVSAMRITAQNMRYPLHADDFGTPPSLLTAYEDVTFEHLGNDEARAWQAANGGDPGRIWNAEHGCGPGMSSGDEFAFRRCRMIGFGANGNAFASHNNQGFTRASRTLIAETALVARSTTASAIYLGSLGSGVRDVVELHGNSLTGPISLCRSPWLPTDPARQIANKMETAIIGSGNTPVPFVHVVDGSVALRIDSATTGAASAVVLGGSAVPILFGGQVAVRPAVGLAAAVHGTWDVGEHAVGINQDTNITAMGYRLGDCRSTPLSLTVAADGGAAVTVALNQDYRAQSNATILAAINAALGSNAVASLFDPNDLYRPLFTDQEIVIQNTGASTILRKTAVARGGAGLDGRTMTPADPASAFAGLAYEHIRPGEWGRVKTGGQVRVAQDMLRTDAAAFVRGQGFGIADASGRFSLSSNGAVLRAVSALDAEIIVLDARYPRIVAQMLGSQGYRKWSDGVIEQWGYVGAGSGDASVSFPIAFPSAVWAISATIQNGATNAGTLESVHIASIGLSSFVGCPRFVLSGSAGQAGEPWTWQARGN